MNYKYKSNPKNLPFFTTALCFLLFFALLTEISPYAGAFDITAAVLNRFAEELDDSDAALEELYNKVIDFDFVYQVNECSGDAIKCYNEIFDKETIELCVEAARNNDPRAMYLVGDLCSLGIGIEENKENARSFFEQAAEAGDVYAMCRTAQMYQYDFDDYSKALEWYSKALEKDCPYAMRGFGDLYLEGHGVEKDEFQALEWYWKAADNGDYHALNRIGMMYLLGHGDLDQEPSQAMDLFREAAEKGNINAMEWISSMYSLGIGVERDKGKAQEWLEKSVTAARAQLLSGDIPTEEPASDEKWTFSVTSQITGETLSSAENHAVGSYAITYPGSSDGVTIPYPETAFPGGYTYHSTDSSNDGMWYAFTTSSGEYDAVKYWNLLAQYGFSCTSETLLGTKKYYYASVSGMPQIIIKDNSNAVKRGSSIAVMVPYGYSFAMPGEAEIQHFDVETAFYPNDYDHNKDRFTTCPVDSNGEIVKVVFSFKPDRYSEGTNYSLDDFLAQTPSVCNYSCDLFCSELSDGRYTSYDYVLAEKDSYKKFEAIDVYILQNSNNEVVMYFYIKAVNQAGITFEIESISSFSDIGEDSEPINGFDESGKCLNCGGSGKEKCRSCNGEGEERCSLCRGSGKIVNGQGKKVLCHRCGGRGKSDCIRCENGRRDCKVCGGSGHK